MITKNYIKMCEKAEEIQRNWYAKSGDWVYCRENKKTVVLYYNEHHGDPPVKYTSLRTAIWLPTQEQLQEMIVDPTLNIAEFSKWALKAIEDADYYMQFDSWNELWLAFVMKECYNKEWLNGRWVKNEDR